MAAPLQPLIIAALALVMGVLLIVLGSTVVERHNGWPLLCLVFYVFTPIPFFLCGSSPHHSYSGSGPITLFRLVGLFIGGACAAIGPLMALMLWHLGSISGAALALTLLSGVCFLISSRVLLASNEEDSDGEEVEEDDIFG